LVSLLTALADDELIIGHRHSEWTGFAPHLEEDVAFSSIAQDEIGHAAALFGLVAKLTGDDPDHLAFGRDPSEYRNAVLCERPNRDWAYTLARHWLYDTADGVRHEALEDAADPEFRALIVKMRREERYHLLHADTWLKRIAHGPVEGRTKVMDALSEALPEAAAIFDALEDEEDAVKQGWMPVPSTEMRARFLDRATAFLDSLGLPTEITRQLDETAEFVASSSGDLIASDDAGAARASRGGGAGGRQGHHSADFDALWDEMTSTYRHDPGATW
jgi:ring-1,2-phenylacetyl-CoA epoxidase subunit PaaC